MNENKIQEELSKELLGKQHKCIVPNSHVLGSESDLVSVTQSDFVIEYEIKTSRQDFRSEMRAYEMVGSFGKDNGHKSYSFSKRKKHRWMEQRYEGKDVGSISVPNRFYLVCPDGIIDPDEVPDLWGFYQITEDFLIKKTIQATKIHSEKVDQSMIEDIARILSFRLWTDTGEIIR